MAVDQATLVKPIIERESLREQIASSLRAAVVSGKLEPGVVYSVPSLAVQFGISATPVREAMLELVRDGLVEPVRNKGFRVSGVTDDQLDEITKLRALIEIPMVAAVAKIATEEQIDDLQKVAERICVAAEAGDLAGFLENDRAFHLGLLAISGNQLIVDTVSKLRMRTRLYGLPRLERERRLLKSAEEHLDIVDALRRRDSGAAERLMRDHLGHVRSLWAAPDEV
jgi:DNA-binding GntR family transcriptional regulator